MIFYRDSELTIRNMEEADAQLFVDGEIEQGWNVDISKFLTRLRDQAEGKCVSLTAVYGSLPAGYVSVYATGLGGAFSGRGLPEIVDLGVLEKYRGRGIGGKLMDVAEGDAVYRREDGLVIIDPEKAKGLKQLDGVCDRVYWN
ncbi:MAG: GNAT family N-acetyltransferase, partial [Atopobiaceae bacterium]|nr:GNAT family N-acetyltransferase [Atopobiaceae bacterium]